MEKKIRVAPSIIAVDYNNPIILEESLRLLKESNIALLHLDVMDGKFVPEKHLGLEFVEKMKEQTDFVLDVHLMTEIDNKVINGYIDAGADILTVHYEATDKLKQVLEKIKAKGILAGVSIKPDTPVEVLDEYLNMGLIDVVLVMSVEPGACGRPFDLRALPKIEYLRRKFPKVDIEVDGGININNANMIVQLGANILVSGSAIFNSDKPKQKIEELKKLKHGRF